MNHLRMESIWCTSWATQAVSKKRLQCQHKLVFLHSMISELSYLQKDQSKIGYEFSMIITKTQRRNTWFAKSATEWMTSANITWLEVANQTPNLRENTRKLHHKAVVTARWLLYIWIKTTKEKKKKKNLDAK